MPTPWDAVYKQLLTQFLNRHNVNVATEVFASLTDALGLREVGRLPRKIDVVAVCSPTDRKHLATISPFTFFQQYNLMEFKSPSDPLTPDEYKRILARTYLYLCEVGVDDLSIITVCAVTSGKPTKVLTNVPSLVRFSPVGQGLYKSDDKMPFYLLVVAELSVEERNYPLLLFSKGKQRETFLRELVQKKAVEYIRFAYELYPQDVKEVLTVSKDFPTLEENIQFIIKDLGHDRIIQALLEQIRSEELAGLNEEEQTQLQQLLNKLENGKKKKVA